MPIEAGRLIQESLPEPDGNNTRGVFDVQVPEGETYYVEEAFFVVESAPSGIPRFPYKLTTFIGFQPEVSDILASGNSARLFTATGGQIDTLKKRTGAVSSLNGTVGDTTTIGGYLYGGERITVFERDDGGQISGNLKLVLVGRRVL